MYFFDIDCFFFHSYKKLLIDSGLNKKKQSNWSQFVLKLCWFDQKMEDLKTTTKYLTANEVVT